MTRLSGNRSLLQAFLADAQRYLEEYRQALASPAAASADAALEAVRGIRIGAEFLEILPLAGLCRQQESRLARAGGALPEAVLESLSLAAGEIDLHLAALDAPEVGAAAPAAAAQVGVGGTSGESVAPAAAENEAQAPEPPPEQPMPDFAPREPSAAAAPAAEMFQEWMREWRAFREQIERIYLAAGPAPPAAPSELRIAEALPAERAPEPAAPVAGPAPQAAPAAQTMAVLKLGIGPALVGLPAANVLGFVEPTRDVRRLSADGALAAVNGSALAVLDVRGRWGLGERPADARIVLVESGRGRIGLWADRVYGTESLSIQPLLPAALHPAELGGAAVSAQGEVVLMLRPEAIAAPENVA